MTRKFIEVSVARRESSFKRALQDAKFIEISFGRRKTSRKRSLKDAKFYRSEQFNAKIERSENTKMQGAGTNRKNVTVLKFKG